MNTSSNVISNNYIETKAQSASDNSAKSQTEAEMFDKELHDAIADFSTPDEVFERIGAVAFETKDDNAKSCLSRLEKSCRIIKEKILNDKAWSNPDSLLMRYFKTHKEAYPFLIEMAPEQPLDGRAEIYLILSCIDKAWQQIKQMPSAKNIPIFKIRYDIDEICEKGDYQKFFNNYNGKNVIEGINGSVPTCKSITAAVICCDPKLWNYGDPGHRLDSTNNTLGQLPFFAKSFKDKNKKLRQLDISSSPMFTVVKGLVPTNGYYDPSTLIDGVLIAHVTDYRAVTMPNDVDKTVIHSLVDAANYIISEKMDLIEAGLVDRSAANKYIERLFLDENVYELALVLENYFKKLNQGEIINIHLQAFVTLLIANKKCCCNVFQFDELIFQHKRQLMQLVKSIIPEIPQKFLDDYAAQQKILLCWDLDGTIALQTSRFKFIIDETFWVNFFDYLIKIAKNINIIIENAIVTSRNSLLQLKQPERNNIRNVLNPIYDSKLMGYFSTMFAAYYQQDPKIPLEQKICPNLLPFRELKLGANGYVVGDDEVYGKLAVVEKLQQACQAQQAFGIDDRYEYFCDEEKINSCHKLILVTENVASSAAPTEDNMLEYVNVILARLGFEPLKKNGYDWMQIYDPAVEYVNVGRPKPSLSVEAGAANANDGLKM